MECQVCDDGHIRWKCDDCDEESSLTCGSCCLEWHKPRKYSKHVPVAVHPETLDELAERWCELGPRGDRRCRLRVWALPSLHLFGGHVWESSRHLANLVSVAPALWKGRTIIELGAGCAALPSLATGFCGARTVVATDVVDTALDLVERAVSELPAHGSWLSAAQSSNDGVSKPEPPALPMVFTALHQWGESISAIAEKCGGAKDGEPSVAATSSAPASAAAVVHNDEKKDTGSETDYSNVRRVTEDTATPHVDWILAARVLWAPCNFAPIAKSVAQLADDSTETWITSDEGEHGGLEEHFLATCDEVGLQCDVFRGQKQLLILLSEALQRQGIVDLDDAIDREALQSIPEALAVVRITRSKCASR